MRSIALSPEMIDADSSQPILGVGLEQYAALSAEMLASGVTQEHQIEDFAVAHGITAGTWAQVQTGWVERLQRSEQLRDRYRDLTRRFDDQPTTDPSDDG
jgi:hypothetical protein